MSDSSVSSDESNDPFADEKIVFGDVPVVINCQYCGYNGKTTTETKIGCLPIIAGSMILL